MTGQPRVVTGARAEGSKAATILEYRPAKDVLAAGFMDIGHQQGQIWAREADTGDYGKGWPEGVIAGNRRGSPISER